MKKKMTVVLVAGARPNFMKIAPIYRALKKSSRFKTIFVHTEQHYDWLMSQSHLKDLQLPKPHFNLGVGRGTQAQQTAKCLVALEKVFLKIQPDWVVVVGDVNSTLAATLAAKKLNLRVAHVEAGLRSFDRNMPEEINRLATDAISDLLLTHSQEASQQLLREGVSKSKVHFVGNVMIDSLFFARGLSKQKQSIKPYGLVTLHRPSNVDDRIRLLSIMQVLEQVSKHIPLIFPVHPRTQKILKTLNATSAHALITKVEPLPYLSFVDAMANANFVITDSGGVQEETTALGVPCLTLRKNTERSITVTRGTNTIVGEDPKRLLKQVIRLIGSKNKSPTRALPKWDGKTAERIVALLEKF